MNINPQLRSQPFRPSARPIVLWDRWLAFAAFGLLLIGLMMVASSSVMIATRYHHQPFYFLIRQSAYVAIGLIAALVVMRIDSSKLEKVSVLLLMFSLVLLILVLIPGIGKVVNGSRRWIGAGMLRIQVSEIAKLAMILFLSGYLVRQRDAVQNTMMGFVKPIIVLGIVGFLLLLEPDFGATVVIAFTMMAMLFLAGVKIRYYVVIVAAILVCLSLLAVLSPYRMARLTAFLDPWADQFNSGYQLTQSLIAFGRGGWSGVGLGESVQKLFYLPEAHTDFLFAVLAEELGLIGIMLVMLLYSILVIRGLKIGYQSYLQDRLFASYVAYGLTCWMGFQAAVNMGVNAGLLPTKGLTLPLLSYGGASMIINCIVVALLLRIDYENRWQSLGFSRTDH